MQLHLTDRVDEEGNVKIMFLSLQRQCISIELTNTEGYLQCDTSCSITMIQTALTYMLNQYPHIKKVHLQDETFPTEPLITPRRLLKGQLGWYEEYLGAYPLLDILKEKLKHLRKPETQAKLQTLLPSNWWIPTNIIPIAEQLQENLFHYLIGTMWVISASTIRNYNIEPGSYQKRMKHIFAKRPKETLSRQRYL